jgi:hypothetical protein
MGPLYMCVPLLHSTPLYFTTVYTTALDSNSELSNLNITRIFINCFSGNNNEWVSEWVGDWLIDS